MAAIIAVMMASTTTLFSQVVTPDSIKVLKQQKNTLQLNKQINERKLKLAKLENKVEQKTREMLKAKEVAQKSANENVKGASNLSSNSQNKRLARKAKKAARMAKRDSRRARIANENLENLKKEIESLKYKIADDETRLQKE